MKKLRPLAMLLVLVMVLTACGSGGAGGKKEETAKGNAVGDKAGITVATLTQMDAWPAFAAIKDGSAKELGYNLQAYEAGIPMVEQLALKKWQIGDAGAVPAMLGVLNRNAAIIGIASDESAANVIIAKEGSPVLKAVSGTENVYGDAESVRGKAIYTSGVSSAHFMLDRYLKKIGLNDGDVNVQYASQKECLAAFEDGRADLVVLWAPFTHEAMQKGGKVVATGKDVGAVNYMLYLADKDWAAEHKDQVVSFLKLTSAQVEKYQKDDDSLMASFKEFYKEYAGMDMSEETLKEEKASHQLFTNAEQLKLLQDGSGERALEEIARFFMDQGKLAESNYGRLVKNKFQIDTQYLEAAQS